MLVVCICYCYNFHIFLCFALENRVARIQFCSRGMSCGLARFNDGPGWCSDGRGRLLRGYYQFHVKQNIYNIPSTCYIDCICRLQYSSLRKINGVLTLGNVPRSGAFDMTLSNCLCFSINLHMVVRMLWIGTLLIGSCITIAFLKRWNILSSNSQMYFRNIPIDYHNL